MAQTAVMNTGWLFLPEDDTGASFMGYDDSAWRRVNLPHDWSVAQPFSKANASGTGYLPGGTAWYRKHFEIRESLEGRVVRLTFGGVYKHARVWVNSYYLGQQAYGYSTFTFDITPFAKQGENVISVRVEHNDVADSRWFTGSGIYRDVTLEICDRVCFRPYGVFVTSEAADAGKATLRIRWDTVGASGVRFELKDAEGHIQGVAAGEGEKGETLLSVSHPVLWSPDRPYLYRLCCTALEAGTPRDTVIVPTGIRTFRFDPDHGFSLNGIPMKLKGVCVHHDAGALGAAVPKAVWERRLRILKTCGCNAIRTAHNPPDTHLLDACDELGFLVMDEAFDEWEGCKNKWWQGHNVYPPKHYGYSEDFPQWHRQDLETMILRDRNHPSIVLWSIGNEVDYPNDPYVTPVFREVLGNNDANKPLAERLYDPRKPDATRLVTVSRELVEIVHALDTTRAVLSAMSFPELSTRTGFAQTLDLFGYNYREKFYDEDHARFPDKVILGSENSHSTDAWFAVEDREFISGQFLWTGIDFLGECRGWPVRISQAGMLDLAGFKKPLAALRTALWTDQPLVAISAGTGEKPWEQHFLWWADPAAEAPVMTVCCFTNQQEVTLYLNGKNLGTKAAGRENGCRATWQVPYEAGELKAVAGAVTDVLRTPGAAVRMELRPAEMAGDLSAVQAGDILQTELRLLDETGSIAAQDNRTVTVQVLGDAEILGMENGKPDDLTPYSAPYRSTYHGRLMIYLRKGMLPGPVTLHVFEQSTGMACDCTLA